MSLQSWTEIFILGTIVIWIAWDIYVYKKVGNIATESWTMKKWSYYAPGLACLLGILLGHFFFTFSNPQQLCPGGTAAPIAAPTPIAKPAPVVIPVPVLPTPTPNGVTK